MTNKLDVSVTVRAEVPGTRTFAVACVNDNLDMDVYENHILVQGFVRDRMDDPAYRLSVVELSPPHPGYPVEQTQSGGLLQAFDTFNNGSLNQIETDRTYNVYFVTFQSIEAKNPTIKVVTKQQTA